MEVESCKLLSSVSKDSLIAHRDTIIKYLTPSHDTMEKFVTKYKFVNFFKQIADHETQAGFLVDEILAQNQQRDYEEFLTSLEEKEDHLGHKYIALLLKGESFKDEAEKHEESQKILQKMDQMSSFVITNLNMEHLLPRLFSFGLVTTKEMEEMISNKMSQENATKFLTLLKTKGPSAHYIFLHDCLVDDKEHHELYKKLTAVQIESNIGSKRAAPDFKSLTKKCYPVATKENFNCMIFNSKIYCIGSDNFSLKRLPTGLEQPRYISRMLRVRQNKDLSCLDMQNYLEHLAEDQSYSLEARIAFQLERGYFCTKDISKTDKIVSRAEKMCLELQDSGCNVAALWSRCKLVRGRCFTICGDNEKAQEYIDKAISGLNLTAQEDRILANYFKALLFLNDPNNSQWDLIDSCLNEVIKQIEDTKQNYGMDIVQYCKIRLAQSYIHSSADHPVSNKAEIQSTTKLQNAQVILEKMQLDWRSMLPTVKFFYLIACSDVARKFDTFDKAADYIEQASGYASKPFHFTIIDKRRNLCGVGKFIMESA